VADAPLVIDAHSLTKAFGDVIALDAVDLVVQPGQIHGLLGPNGAGKTTLLSIIFGLAPPDAGTLRLFGRTRAEAGPRFLDGVAGFVETPTFYPYLTARQNLAAMARLDGIGGAPTPEHVLDLVGLAEAAGEKVRGFSLGMRQRLGLAAALLRQPRLLVVDEPANGLDAAGARDLHASFARLAAQGLSVLLSSHNMVEIDQLCDQVTVLRGGRVVFAGSIGDMRADAPDPAYRLTTSDDVAALTLALDRPGLVAVRHDDGGLAIHARQPHLDDYVVALGRAGIALRSLALEVAPLESLFFLLTEPEGPDAATLGRPLAPPPPVAAASATPTSGRR
jgi:ABC-2 type transport system ATP-binding protein